MHQNACRISISGSARFHRAGAIARPGETIAGLPSFGAAGHDPKNCARAGSRPTVSKTAVLPDCNGRIACYTAASRLPALVRRSEPQETPMSDDKIKPPGFQYSLTNLKPVESGKIALTFPDGARRE